MYCEKCGGQLNYGDKFCNNCGAPVTGNRMPYEPVRRPVVKKSTDNMIQILFIVFAVVVVVCAGAIYGAFKMNKPKKTLEMPTVTDKPTVTTKVYTGENATRTEMPAYESEPEPTEEPEYEYEYEHDTGYICGSKYISREDLSGKSKHEVAMMRNEIYARNGYIFKNEPYKSHFESKDWYVPNPNFSESLFSDIELSNKHFIVEYEKAMGWR